MCAGTIFLRPAAGEAAGARDQLAALLPIREWVLGSDGIVGLRPVIAGCAAVVAPYFRYGATTPLIFATVTAGVNSTAAALSRRAAFSVKLADSSADAVRRHPRRVQILELGHLLFFFIVLCRDLLVVPCGQEPSACTAHEQREHEEQTVDDRHISTVPLLLVVFGGPGLFRYHASVSRQLAS